jgi:hypothetical protein
VKNVPVQYKMHPGGEREATCHTSHIQNVSDTDQCCKEMKKKIQNSFESFRRKDTF